LSYSDLIRIFSTTATWEEFLEKVSCGEAKWTLLSVLEEGWRNRVHRDLVKTFSAPVGEASDLLERYACLVVTITDALSVPELLAQLNAVVVRINQIRGYLRYAYYIKIDDEDVVIAKVDEMLTDLGSGTPTSTESASSYTTVTGTAVSEGAIVLPEGVADEIANQLAVLIDDLQNKLHTQAGVPEQALMIVAQLEKLDELYSILTGKSLVDNETLTLLRTQLTRPSESLMSHT